MIICSCYGLSDQDARQAISRGALDRRQLAERLGLQDGCGGCLARFDELLERERSRRGLPPLATLPSARSA